MYMHLKHFETIYNIDNKIIPLCINQVTSGQAFCSTPRCWAGWWWRLGAIPQEAPVNQKNKPKIGALQNACPKFISRPQAQSSYKPVSYRMVGLEICLTCTYPTSLGNTAILFPGPRNIFFLGGTTWKIKSTYSVSTSKYRFLNQSIL